MSPEYEQILALYLSGTPPAGIAARLEIPRRRVNWVVLELRRRGLVPADMRAPPSPPPRPPRSRIVLSLDPDLAAAVTAAAGDRGVDGWVLDQVRLAASRHVDHVAAARVRVTSGDVWHLDCSRHEGEPIAACGDARPDVLTTGDLQALTCEPCLRLAVADAEARAIVAATQLRAVRAAQGGGAACDPDGEPIGGGGP